MLDIFPSLYKHYVQIIQNPNGKQFPIDAGHKTPLFFWNCALETNGPGPLYTHKFHPQIKGARGWSVGVGVWSHHQGQSGRGSLRHGRDEGRASVKRWLTAADSGVCRSWELVIGHWAFLKATLSTSVISGWPSPFSQLNLPSDWAPGQGGRDKALTGRGSPRAHCIIRVFFSRGWCIKQTPFANPLLAMDSLWSRILEINLLQRLLNIL